MDPENQGDTSDSLTDNADTSGSQPDDGGDLLARMQKMASDTPEPEAADDEEDAPPAKKIEAKPKDKAVPGKGEKKADAVDTSDAKAADEAAEDEGPPVPQKAFKARLGKEVAKRREAETKLGSLQLETAKLRAALELSAEQITRYRGALENNEPFDERAESLHERELSLRAHEMASKINQEQTQHQERYRQEAQLSVMREQLSGEVEAALAAHPLLSRGDLIAAAQAAPMRSIAETASSLQAYRLEAAKKLLATAQPDSPRTVRARVGGNTARKYDLNAKGMMDFLKDREGLNT